MFRVIALILFSLVAASEPALAAEPFDGSKLSLIWVVPFAGILLSIAIFPWLRRIFGITISARYRCSGRSPS